MRKVQWAPSGNPFSGIPGEVVNLLASDGKTYGYGYGKGWELVFYHKAGSVSVSPKQWVVVHDDGRVTVEDIEPAG